MLLRIALIVAILAGVGALALNKTKVKQKIIGLTEELSSTKTTLEATQKSEREAKNEAKKANVDLKKTRDDLAGTQKNLEAVTTKANDQEKLAKDKSVKLDDVTKQYNDAQRELAQWQALTIRPDQVEALKVEAKNLTSERDAFAAEKVVLLRNNSKLDTELRRYKGDTAEIVMEGVKGKVIAVDSKWEFVILDIGINQGAKQDGKLLVARNGKLIGKVRLTTVEPTRSIANIIPEMKQGEVMEGDVVFY